MISFYCVGQENKGHLSLITSNVLWFSRFRHDPLTCYDAWLQYHENTHHLPMVWIFNYILITFYYIYYITFSIGKLLINKVLMENLIYI